MFKFLGPVARLIQTILTFFVGDKMARDRTKLKGLKAKVKAMEAKDEVDALSDDDVAVQLSEWVHKPGK